MSSNFGVLFHAHDTISGYQNFMKRTLGVWMYTASVMKWVIGLETQNPACLVEIQTGEVQFVSDQLLFDAIPLFNRSHLGLATNFLLIESLQRFYQYYGDDLQV